MNNIETFPKQAPFRPAGPALALGRALSAEILKTKRTLAFWLTLLAPALIVAMNFMIVIERGESLLADVADTWSFFNRQNLLYWALLMQPLFVSLETALMAQLDHADDHWKHLFALPVPRWAVYFAKQIINTMLILLSMLFLYVYTILSGQLLRWLRPGLGFEAPVPIIDMASLTLLAFLSAWLIISIQNWVSLRWRSFVVACGFGIAMTIAGIMVINSTYAGYYPWTMSASLMINIADGHPYLHILALGSLGGLLLAVIGVWVLRHRDIL